MVDVYHMQGCVSIDCRMIDRSYYLAVAQFHELHMADRLPSAVYYMPSHCYVCLMLILIYFLSTICRLSSVTLPNGCPLISMTNYGMLYLHEKKNFHGYIKLLKSEINMYA